MHNVYLCVFYISRVLQGPYKKGILKSFLSIKVIIKLSGIYLNGENIFAKVDVELFL